MTEWDGHIGTLLIPYDEEEGTTHGELGLEYASRYARRERNQPT